MGSDSIDFKGSDPFNIQQSSPHLIPWAWGINGCASVLSSVLAVLLAIEVGFNGVMLCAVVLYLIAWRNN